MSMFFTNEPNANRFAARNRNQGSLDIFGTGASSSAAPATSRPSSRASAPHLSHTDHTSSSVPASSPARNQVEVAEKEVNRRFDPQAYVHEAPSKSRQDLSSSNAMRDLLASRGGPAPSPGGGSRHLTQESSGNILLPETHRQTGRGSGVSRPTSASLRNPILDGDAEPAPTGRRLVPEYFNRPEPTPRKRGSKPDVDSTAAGVVTAKAKEGFVPGLKIVPGPPSAVEVERTSHKRFCESSHLIVGSHANPILQNEASFDRPSTARQGIRVFPDKINHENTAPEATNDLPLQSLRRIADPHASRDPIRGDVPEANHATGLKVFRDARSKNNDDVIGYQYGKEINTAGASDRAEAPSQQALNEAAATERASTKAAYDKHRSRTTSSSALGNYIYDKPDVKPWKN